MHLTTVVVICLGLAALTYAEECTVNSDCHGTGCTSGYHVICEHKAETGVTSNGGFCTCAVDNLTCKTKDDCLSDAISLSCSDNRKHCYDNKCICTRFGN